MWGLRILRWMFGAVCTALGPFSEKYRWLGHYLWGRGDNLLFPPALVDWEAVTHAVVTQGDGHQGRYRLKHYQLDRERGLLSQFLGGNEMFYVLATVEFSVGLDQFRKQVLIQGMDLYWWHENPDGSWPIGLHLPRWLGAPLRWLCPAGRRDAWFPPTPHGGYGLSNELWADMTEVGARTFYTIMAINLDPQAWAHQLEQARLRLSSP